MKKAPTYYEILGIASNAKHNDVGLAFNRKMRALKREDAPPDLQGETKLREAFAVLSDLEKRAAYDAKLRADFVKPKFGKNHGAVAALFVVAVGAGLFWYLRPQVAPEYREVKAPGKPYQEILNGAIPAIGRLQTVAMSGEAQHAGIAFTVMEGVAVTSCKGLSPTAQLNVALAPRVIPARVTVSDDDLGICQLEVPGAGTWPLSVSQSPAKVGDTVYTTFLSPTGDVAIQKAQVQAIKEAGKATLLEVSVPLRPEQAGSPLLDMYGRVVAVANVPPGGKEAYVAIPPAWGEAVKLSNEPRPYQGASEPQAGETGKQQAPIDDFGRSEETRKAQEALAGKVDPETRKRLEKAYVPARDL